MILTIAGSIFALVVIFIGLIWIFQERIAFQPPRPPFPEARETRRITYTAQDGQPLVAYIIGEPATAKGLVLFFHGNADLAVHAIDWAERTARVTGFAVMLAEYRGYMGLGGRPTYATSQLDSEAAFLCARDSLHVSPKHIAYYGHSLGSAVATELAVRHPPSVLLLESPFTSARAMGRVIGHRAVQLAWSTIARFHFDTRAQVASINAPVWVVHGARDRLIPSLMGSEVFAAAKVKGRILLVPNASHNDVALMGGSSYWEWIKSALSQ